jgi:hypothetical protein
VSGPVTAKPDARRRAALIPMLTVTVVAGAAFVVGSAISAVGLVVAVAVVQAALITTWILGAGVPGRIGGIVIGVVAAGVGDVCVVRWHDNGYQPLLAVLGLAIPVMFVHQLTRGVVRTRVVESLSDIALGLVAVAAVSGLILLRYSADGDKTVVAVVAAMAAALVVDQLVDLGMPLPRFDATIDRGLVGVLLGVVAGGAAGVWALRDIVDFSDGRAALAGAVTGAVACLVSVGASFAGAHSTLSAPVPEAPTTTGPASALAETPPTLTILPGGRDVPGGTYDDQRDPAADEDLPSWRGVVQFRPVAAALMTLALTVPAGYVLVSALSS